MAISINTRRARKFPPSRPVQNYVSVIAAASVLVTSPLWLTDVLLHALRPLGIYDTSMAVWITLFSVPLIVLVAVSSGPVLKARKRHVGDFANLDAVLGTRMSTLAGACLVVEYLAAYTLLIATAVLIATTLWKPLWHMRVPLAVIAAVLTTLPVLLSSRRLNKTTATLTALTFVLLLFLTVGLIGASPYFSTSGSSDLADVSREVAARSNSSMRIMTAVLAGITVSLLPAVLLRHITTNLGDFNRPRAANATMTRLTFALATSILTISVVANVADVDSGAYVSRTNAVFSSLEAIHVHPVLLKTAAVVFIATLLAGARLVLNNSVKLGLELSHFQLLPDHIARSMTYTGITPLFHAVGASVLLIIGQARPRFVVPILIISGFITLTLTRWASMKHWGSRLRTEGHSSERITMKRARIVALVGLIICIAVIAAFLLADITRGAWIAAAAIGTLYLLLYTVRRHYLIYGSGAGETTTTDPIAPGRVHYMIVATDLGPVLTRATRWIRSTRPYSMELIHVDEGGNDVETTLQQWRKQDLDVDLTILEPSRPRATVSIIEHIRRTRKAHPNRLVNVVIPRVTFAYPWQNRLHNTELTHLQRALTEEPGVLITIVPWADQINEAELTVHD